MFLSLVVDIRWLKPKSIGTKLEAGFDMADVIQWNESSEAMSGGNSHGLKMNFCNNLTMVGRLWEMMSRVPQ